MYVCGYVSVCLSEHMKLCLVCVYLCMCLYSIVMYVCVSVYVCLSEQINCCSVCECVELCCCLS